MKKQNPLSRIYHPIKDYIFILIGTLIYATGLVGFILPCKVVPGGLTGACSFLLYLTGIPVSVSYAVLNVGLLVLAYRLLGKRFMINSIFGVVALTLSLMLFEWLLQGEPIIKDQPFMAILIGGAFCGAGLGIIFSANGSTGGTDIIGAVVNKHRNVSIGRTLFICDFIVIGSSYFIFHDIEKIVFGFVEMLVNNYVLDRMINANNQSVQFLIFSPKYKDIAQQIVRDLGRGCTILDGSGGFTGEPVKVIILLARKRERVTIFRLIKAIDPNAFISQSNVRGVYGEGFDRIKG